MKYLIAGLGNIGDEYQNTRHNIGFKVLDELAGSSNLVFKQAKLAFVTEFKHKARTFILIKPTTFMNLSGKAVAYWMQTEKIQINKLLVVTDDIALPFGKIRIKGKGSDGGHNGLKSINESLATNHYARLRFGVGNDFPKGRQAEYVLSEWNNEEKELLQERINVAVEAIKSFGSIGLTYTMNDFNNK